MQTIINQGQAHKSARIELKTTPDVKVQLEQAAAYLGETLTTFIIQAAVPRARHVLSEQQVVRVSDKAWDALNDVLNTPAQAPQKLKDLMRLARK